jgi:hypothetical protein
MIFCYPVKSGLLASLREARIHWGVENNIYQLGHRGYVAVKGGAMDCPRAFLRPRPRRRRNNCQRHARWWSPLLNGDEP